MKTALVTGVSKGIGKAIAESLLADGWKVYGVSRSDPQMSHENFVWIGFDLMNLNDYQQLVDQIPGDLTLLVNNAGIAYKVSLENLLTLDLEKQFTINVKAPIWLMKSLLPKLAHGMVINVTSLAAKMPYPGLAIYSATKSALTSFDQSFAMEYQIPIATLLPGSVDSPLLHTIMGPDADYSGFLTPQDIAKATMKLLSEGIHSGEDVVVVNARTRDEASGMETKMRILDVDTL